jgi:hypothetical protein
VTGGIPLVVPVVFDGDVVGQMGTLEGFLEEIGKLATGRRTLSRLTLPPLR